MTVLQHKRVASFQTRIPEFVSTWEIMQILVENLQEVSSPKGKYDSEVRKKII